jgi:hypothetical protein
VRFPLPLLPPPPRPAKPPMASINALGEIVMSTGAVLGTRQMARYYKQRPRPAETRESVLISAMVQVCVCECARDEHIHSYRRPTVLFHIPMPISW